ncbi:MAG: SEL1-like repeat protein [Kangiellaceae bacterium]|nr:SEL1-like repeat protein [Kangiellaceae bacterium]
MLTTSEILFRVLIVLALGLFVTDTGAARQKESGNQNNIYITEWARLKHQAELGDPDALFSLGNYYYKPPRGSSFRRNLKKSAEYYFQAGIRQNAAAQYNLALMLHGGLGVNKNLVESYVWFKLASVNPSPVAKHVNQVSAEAAATLKDEMSTDEILIADQKLAFYNQIMSEKRYRMAKFPE